MTDPVPNNCRRMSLRESRLFGGDTQKQASRPVKLSVTQENPDGRASQDKTLLPNIAPNESETPQTDAMEKPAGLLISTDVGVVSVLIQICKNVHFQHVIGHCQYRRSLCNIGRDPSGPGNIRKQFAKASNLLCAVEPLQLLLGHRRLDQKSSVGEEGFYISNVYVMDLS